MHRFGRSAQQKMKDRWGGGFILATILALAGAWYLGGFISKQFGAPTASSDLGSGGISSILPGKSGSTGGAQMVMEPHEFQLYFVQVGALRSEAGANKLALGLSQQSLTAMVGAKTKDLHPVMVGPFTSMDALTAAKAKLSAQYQGAFPVTVTVAHNPDAVPAAAMSTKAGADVRKGLDVLNTYLHEGAVWMENRAGGSMADAGNLATLGKQMAQFATAMQAEKDAKVVEFAGMAKAASANATQIQAAAAAMPSSDEYQAALNGYMALLNQYRSFHNGK